MARFDVYRNPEGAGFLLDCQTDLLSGLNTRFVVPLLPADVAPRPAARLNPVFGLGEQSVVMVTQFAAAVPLSILKDCVASLRSEDIAISNAIDMLLSGY
jgi:toxin CcdB